MPWEGLSEILAGEFALGLAAPCLVGGDGILAARAQEMLWAQTIQAAVQARVVREVLLGLRALAASSRVYSFLHAGVVRLEKGLIVIPGISGAERLSTSGVFWLLVRYTTRMKTLYWTGSGTAMRSRARCRSKTARRRWRNNLT